jgi:hypothetical protein
VVSPFQPEIHIFNFQKLVYYLIKKFLLQTYKKGLKKAKKKIVRPVFVPRPGFVTKTAGGFCLVSCNKDGRGQSS